MRKITRPMNGLPVNRHQTQKRTGAAAVEFAVCLPMIVLLVFGSIEASSFIFLKQGLAVAAYEATREAIRPGSSNGSATAQGQNILNARQVQESTINILSGEVSELESGTEIVVEVSAPTAPNSPLLGSFITNRVLTSRVVMLKE